MEFWFNNSVGRLYSLQFKATDNWLKGCTGVLMCVPKRSQALCLSLSSVSIKCFVGRYSQIAEYV